MQTENNLNSEILNESAKATQSMVIVDTSLNSQNEAQTKVLKIPLIDATAENITDYGIIFGQEVHKPGLSIPFYKGRVIEGDNMDFIYKDHAVIRTAKIMPGMPNIQWLERHMDMTQLFIGLGSEPFIMVLAPPCNEATPDLSKVKAFKFPAGHALLLHKGTWHDFPIAWKNPVVAMTANSAEVVAALAAMKSAGEMNHGDVYKINLKNRLNTELQIDAEVI